MLPSEQIVLSVGAAVMLGAGSSAAVHRAKVHHEKPSIALWLWPILVILLNGYNPFMTSRPPKTASAGRRVVPITT